jgi:DNA (cytosine-5)-methyltransferase 1
MNVLDLFSGIGGFAIGLGRAGFRTVGFCEINPFCRAVLADRWPDVPCHDDVRTFAGVGTDAISAGFPCQDASLGQTQWGARVGIDGERTGLWREVKRLANDLRPRVVVLENVPGLLSAGFGRVLGDLAEIGYDAEWRCIPASKAGLPHRRDRLWVVAYPRGSGLSRHIEGRSILESAEAALTQHGNEAAGAWRSLDRDLDSLRSSDGLPVTAHRRRVEAIGNSIVPQIAEAIGRAIMSATLSSQDGATK